MSLLWLKKLQIIFDFIHKTFYRILICQVPGNCIRFVHQENVSHLDCWELLMGHIGRHLKWSNKHLGWMDERCFRPLLCTVKAELGRGQPGLMRWIWDETLPQGSIDRSTYSAAHRATKWASGCPQQTFRKMFLVLDFHIRPPFLAQSYHERNIAVLDDVVWGTVAEIVGSTSSLLTHYHEAKAIIKFRSIIAMEHTSDLFICYYAHTAVAISNLLTLIHRPFCKYNPIKPSDILVIYT